MNERLATDLASLRIDRSGPPPRNQLLRALLAAAALVVLGVGVYRVAQPWAEAQVFKVEVSVAEIATLAPSLGQVELTATGYLVPQVTAKVGAKVVGRVARADVREGQRVKVGQVLFELDAADQVAAVASARARVAAAVARVLTVKAQRAEVSADFHRQKDLAQSGATARAAADDLERKLASLDAQIKASEAEVLAAEAEQKALATVLKSLVVPAPIDGVAVTKPAVVGDIASPGVPLVELCDLGSLLVEVDVPEARLGLAKVGGACEIALDAMPEKRLRGAVVEVSPRLNRAKATGTVKVQIDGAPEGILPEMSARVSFLAKPVDEASLKTTPKIVVPLSAVIERSGGKAVWVVEDGKARIVNVVLGEALGAGVVLVRGPPPGTRVVKDPPKTLVDGKPVKEKTS